MWFVMLFIGSLIAWANGDDSMSWLVKTVVVLAVIGLIANGCSN